MEEEKKLDIKVLDDNREVLKDIGNPEEVSKMIKSDDKKLEGVNESGVILYLKEHTKEMEKLNRSLKKQSIINGILNILLIIILCVGAWVLYKAIKWGLVGKFLEALRAAGGIL